MRTSRSTGAIQSLLKNYSENQTTPFDDLPFPPHSPDLEANKEETEKSDCNIDSWIAFQYVYNFCLTFANSSISVATFTTLLTDWLGMETVALGFSAAGLGIGIPLGLVLALAEANAHFAESEHFSEPGDVLKEDLAKTTLTWKQSLQAKLHYLSDFFDGIGDQLLIAKFFGIDKARWGFRALTYSGITLFSALGNGKEYFNTRMAFSIQNLKNKK